jgi:hypothetical protein
MFETNSNNFRHPHFALAFALPAIRGARLEFGS